MSHAPCPQCGATFEDPAMDCRSQFAALLALDHSRQEPWGSRHGLVFAAFQLQHPEGLTAEALERCWIALWRVYVAGDDRGHVLAGLRRAVHVRAAEWGVPPLRVREAGTRYAATIADLGDLGAEGYAEAVDRWCRAALGLP